MIKNIVTSNPKYLLNSFEALICISDFLRKNALTTKLNLVHVLKENCQDTNAGRRNVQKWGALPFIRSANNHIRYDRRDLLLWAEENRKNFDKIDTSWRQPTDKELDEILFKWDEN